MRSADDDLRVRPGRIRDGGRGAARPKSFVAQVMQAARKAGHTASAFGPAKGSSGSRFGRGRRAALALSLRSPGRRVVVMSRVVRHGGKQFRTAPLAKHVAYLKRDSVTRDGANARMFDAQSEHSDGRTFAARCEDDRHHFRFTISPEDAARMSDLRAFTRELMAEAEGDLGTKLDWVAVDHWNTDNPHVHVLVRGRADDGKDLVISRDYISRGLRARAADRVTLELGPRSEHEIRSSLEREVEAERWTGLDRALRAVADEGGGIADLRPGSPKADPELRRLMVGRTAKLERLGLADQVFPGCWTFKPSLEQTLCDLSIRGDIIKTMHRALVSTGREPEVSGFALHGDRVTDQVLGRLVERGLHDELTGSAYAVVDGIDGRTHHLQFSTLEMTGDAKVGAIVEARAYQDDKAHDRLSLVVRSDLALQEQVAAPGATWLDRQLLSRHTAPGSGFGAELQDAMDRRIEHLVAEGLAQRQGQQTAFAGDLLGTLRRRELDQVSSKLSAETGLSYQPLTEGERVVGVYRQRVVLSSGRFAMIDDGLGFQLVPWRPALERHANEHVAGVVLPGGRVDWSFGHKRSLSL